MLRGKRAVHACSLGIQQYGSRNQTCWDKHMTNLVSCAWSCVTCDLGCGLQGLIAALTVLKSEARHAVFLWCLVETHSWNLKCGLQRWMNWKSKQLTCFGPRTKKNSVQQPFPCRFISGAACIRCSPSVNCFRVNCFPHQQHQQRFSGNLE